MRLRRMPTGVWLDISLVSCVYDTGHEGWQEVAVVIGSVIRTFKADGSCADEWVAAMQEHSVPR